MPQTVNKVTRREALQRSLAAGAAAAIPCIVPATVLGGARARCSLGADHAGRDRHRSPRHIRSGLHAQAERLPVRGHLRRSGQPPKCGQTIGGQALRQPGLQALSRLPRTAVRRDIDAVLIATGDRWHAPLSMHAARAGKDIYWEKPCGLTIGLCQQLDDVIRQTDRVFQAGTQRRSVSNFQAAVAIGPQRQARQTAYAFRFGLYAVARQLLAAGRADAAARRLRLGYLARPGAVASL